MAARAAALEPLAAVVEVGRAVAGAAGAAGAQADFVPAQPALVDAVRLVLVVRQLGSDQPCTVQKREEKFREDKKIRSARRRRMAIPDTARALNHHGGRYQPRLTCIKLPPTRRERWLRPPGHARRAWLARLMQTHPVFEYLSPSPKFIPRNHLLTAKDKA